MSASVSILGITFEPLEQALLLERVYECAGLRRKSMVLSGNVHSFNLACENEWLHRLLNQADAIRVDGAGLRLGGRLLGYRLPARMTWADFAWELAAGCAERGISLYFLGGRPGVAEEAATRLKEKNPQFRVVGTHHGYFDKRPGHDENTTVIQQINAVKPDILLVGFGMPLQEEWLLHNWDQIDATVAMTGGAVFDYVSGTLRRAPDWLTDNGFEWLGRLLFEPRRLWRRYLLGNPIFIYRILRQKWSSSQVK